MFCPKCGTNNPDDGKFCRSCRADLASVSAALSGRSRSTLGSLEKDLGLDAGSDETIEKHRRSDPNEVYGDAIRALVSGLGFLVVSIVLGVTGVAGGKAWWWALLFPAFTFLAKGSSDLLKSRKMERSRLMPAALTDPVSFANAGERPGLTAPNTAFLVPESKYKTGDLVPPSVTDETTKLLELNKEGETMTLPKP